MRRDLIVWLGLGAVCPRSPLLGPSLAFDGVDAESLLLNLDLKGVSASAGSACSAGSREPSYVLTAMGASPATALSSIRFSLGITNTSAEIDRTIALVIGLVERLRAESTDLSD